MSLSNVFNIAGSAMTAQTVRLNTTASNLANAESVSSSEVDTYRARKPIFALVRMNPMVDICPATPSPATPSHGNA